MGSLCLDRCFCYRTSESIRYSGKNILAGDLSIYNNTLFFVLALLTNLFFRMLCLHLYPSFHVLQPKQRCL